MERKTLDPADATIVETTIPLMSSAVVNKTNDGGGVVENLNNDNKENEQKTNKRLLFFDYLLIKLKGITLKDIVYFILFIVAVWSFATNQDKNYQRFVNELRQIYLSYNTIPFTTYTTERFFSPLIWKYLIAHFSNSSQIRHFFASATSIEIFSYHDNQTSNNYSQCHLFISNNSHFWPYHLFTDVLNNYVWYTTYNKSASAMISCNSDILMKNLNISGIHLGGCSQCSCSFGYIFNK